MIITIPGKPVGKARPKFRRAGFKVITYTPPATKKYEKEVARIYKQSAGVLYTEIPLRVRILAKFPIPESWSKKNKEKALKGEIKPNKKPDLDNIAKIILDGLNGVAYTDDKQVTSLEIEKCTRTRLAWWSILRRMSDGEQKNVFGRCGMHR